MEIKPQIKLDAEPDRSHQDTAKGADAARLMREIPKDALSQLAALGAAGNTEAQAIVGAEVMRQAVVEGADRLKTAGRNALGHVTRVAMGKVFATQLERFEATASHVLGVPEGSPEAKQMAQKMVKQFLRGSGVLAREAVSRVTPIGKEALSANLDEESWSNFAIEMQETMQEHGGVIGGIFHSSALHSGMLNTANNLPSGSKMLVVAESNAPLDLLNKSGEQNGVVVETAVVGKPDHLLKAGGKDGYDAAVIAKQKRMNEEERLALQHRRTSGMIGAIRTLKGANAENPALVMIAVDRPELTTEQHRVDVNQFGTVRQMPESIGRLAVTTGKPIKLMFHYLNDKGEVAVATCPEVFIPTKDEIPTKMQELANYMEEIVRAHPADWLVNRPVEEMWPGTQSNHHNTSD